MQCSRAETAEKAPAEPARQHHDGELNGTTEHGSTATINASKDPDAPLWEEVPDRPLSNMPSIKSKSENNIPAHGIQHCLYNLMILLLTFVNFFL
jgi:hypothetical protein